MKGLIAVCPECGTKTELREITIEFERKGIQAAMSGIPAMVCPIAVSSMSLARSPEM